MVDLDGKTLYEALGVEKEASQAEVRKAYMKLALQLHPDKNPGDEGAKSKFQTLQKVYAILSDEEKRKVYDQTGSIEDSEELAGEKFNDLYRYYRAMYAQVTEDDLDAFHASYQGGEEERKEVLSYYQKFKGDMRKVFEWVMCSDEASDAHRFMDLIDATIAAKEAPSFAKYKAWAKKVAARPRPTAEAAAKAKAKKSKSKQRKGDEGALVAKIQGRGQQGRGLALQSGGMLSRLMAEVESGMPSEEEFQAAQQRLQQKQGGSKQAVAAGGVKKRTKKK